MLFVFIYTLRLLKCNELSNYDKNFPILHNSAITSHSRRTVCILLRDMIVCGSNGYILLSSCPCFSARGKNKNKV